MQFVIIGAAILDILARPIEKAELFVPSYPADHISMSLGGDAANEALVLSRLGGRVAFIGKIGADFAGDTVFHTLTAAGIDCTHLLREPGLDTGINMVLVDPAGERSFITSQNGSLRKLSPADIPLSLFQKGQIVCFASMFVYPFFTPEVMSDLFSHIKKQGCILCADMTRRKNGESVHDVRAALSCLDYVFPNYEEARLLTGHEDIDEIADAILDCGTGCVVLKLDSEGCLVKTVSQRFLLPACKNTVCVDATGAGDSFAAAFLYALSQGFSLKECGRFANAAGSLAVEAMGAANGIRSLSQIRERMAQMEE